MESGVYIGATKALVAPQLMNLLGVQESELHFLRVYSSGDIDLYKENKFLEGADDVRTGKWTIV